jgi:hypothetical protein
MGRILRDVPTKRAIEKQILALLEERGPEKTACPSEIARSLDAKSWRTLMQPVRDGAGRLASRGRIEITQKGKPVPVDARGPIRLRLPASPYRDVDFKKHPELYRVGRGERGVLTAEPYKSELLPLWRFRTEEVAKESARALYKKFVAYRRAKDFVGMDLARKYLQMGFTRARRYANHPSGRKYDAAGRKLEQAASHATNEKARAAKVFKEAWDRVEADPVYRALKAACAT